VVAALDEDLLCRVEELCPALGSGHPLSAVGTGVHGRPVCADVGFFRVGA